MLLACTAPKIKKHQQAERRRPRLLMTKAVQLKRKAMCSRLAVCL